MNRTSGKKQQPARPMVDAERLTLAQRIAKHVPPTQIHPNSARLVLVKMALHRLLAAEKGSIE
jgi:hypothetical protein